MKTLLLTLIRFYQLVLSPLKSPSCRFYPSCSRYCAEAIRQRGVVAGIGLGIWRILRCNPFSRGGYDPVPEGRKAGTRRGQDPDPASSGPRGGPSGPARKELPVTPDRPPDPGSAHRAGPCRSR